MYRRAAILSIAALVCACARPATEPPLPPVKPRGDGPSLVLLLVVDQMRGDYLPRFRPLFDGGLAWLLDHGASFSDARHDHAVTETAPGHATIATGMHPSRSGIAANAWFETATMTEVYSGGSGAGAGPANLREPALGDWLKAANRRSRVFSASGKDRSAIMMGGQNADGVYWYDRRNGDFRSAPYYRKALRPWLIDFNNERRLDRFFGQSWLPLDGAPEAGTYGVEPADTGWFQLGFPHALGSYGPAPDAGFYAVVGDSPYLDWYLAELGKQIIEAEQLGMDGDIDLLALSFSALDYVGHDYGPDSPEALDALRRLDRTLMDLLTFIDERVGLDHVAIALSSDHGVVPLPEMSRWRGIDARRLDADDYRCVQQSRQLLRERLGDEEWFVDGMVNGSDFYVNPDALGRTGVAKATVESEMAALLQRCDAIARVWTGTEILAMENPPPGSVEALLVHGYVPDRSPHLVLQLVPYALSWQGMGTSHGSVYEYDTHVPIVVAGAGVQPGTYDGDAFTIDIAPTLADMVGLTPPPDRDGRSLLLHLGDRHRRDPSPAQ